VVSSAAAVAIEDLVVLVAEMALIGKHRSTMTVV
jgi:hypothetical protein